MKITSYKDWAIFWKIMIIPLISLILIVLGTEFLMLPKIESWLLEQEKVKLRNVVELVHQQIAQGARAVEERHIPLEQAQKEVIRHISELRYAGTEYFWINDLSPRIVMHAARPDLVGKDATDITDSKGKFLYREFVEIAKDKGEGFTSYMWARMGETTPSPKVSYIKLYRPWGWIVGSGLYVDTFKDKIASLHRFVLGGSVLFSLVLIALAWSIGRGVKRSIDRGCEFAAAVASGDMTGSCEVESMDEVGVLETSLNTMVGGLKAMIEKVTITTRELAATSGEIAVAARSMLGSAEQQTRDVEETSGAAVQIRQQIDRVSGDMNGLNRAAAESSSAVHELASSIEEVARHMESLVHSVEGIGNSITRMTGSIHRIDVGVQTLNDSSSETAGSVLEFDASIRQIESYATETAVISDAVRCDAETGRQAVTETIAGIDVIMRAFRITSDATSELSSKADSIGSIVTVIEEIAEQTKLLALNATILSAQAGEHGKGFAVVAAEIKQLAQRTGRSTQEIGETIKGIQVNMSQAVKAIAASEESIRNGRELSLKAGDALEKVVGGVTRTAGQMSEIARATKEQARGSLLIRTAMDQVAAMASSIAENTGDLRRNGDMIQGEIGKVREVSSQVMRSVKEQAHAGTQISQLALEVSSSTARILDACADQTAGSERIQRAVESIRASANSVLEETRVVDRAVSKLGSNSRSLQQETDNFKL